MNSIFPPNIYPNYMLTSWSFTILWGLILGPTTIRHRLKPQVLLLTNMMCTWYLISGSFLKSSRIAFLIYESSSNCPTNAINTHKSFLRLDHFVTFFLFFIAFVTHVNLIILSNLDTLFSGIIFHQHPQTTHNNY